MCVILGPEPHPDHSCSQARKRIVEPFAARLHATSLAAEDPSASVRSLLLADVLACVRRHLLPSPLVVLRTLPVPSGHLLARTVLLFDALLKPELVHDLRRRARAESQHLAQGLDVVLTPRTLHAVGPTRLFLKFGVVLDLLVRVEAVQALAEGLDIRSGVGATGLAAELQSFALDEYDDIEVSVDRITFLGLEPWRLSPFKHHVVGWAISS